MIPTAKDFLKKRGNSELTLIDFAKLHVEAALKAATNDVDFTDETYASMQEGSICNVDNETILNAYPLTNIK